MVMIKDNHISVAGGITNAMRSVDQFLEKEKLTVPVEVLYSDAHIEKDIPTCLSFIFLRFTFFACLLISFNYVHMFS